MFEESIARITDLTARLQAKSASLSATIERWEIVMTAKLERRPLDTLAMKFALESEKILPRWKHQPHSFHTLASGEVVVFGGEQTAHTVRTMYMRPNYTLADISYLEQCISASYVITVEHADTILRTIKPDTSHSKRRPCEADADPDMRMEYRQRPERRLSPRELVMESGLKGRALARELARIK